MAWTTPTDSKLFFTRNDATDPRLGEWAKSFSPARADDFAQHPGAWALLGYPDDEGIAMNGGRPGAKEAPQTIRTYFYKMTPSLINPKAKVILDLGNVPTELALPERHERGREILRAALTHGHRTLSLGGGHDYGYADGAGFIDYCLARNQRPVVINFDAHLDVRPTDRGFHSGTPFNRLLTQYEGKFDFIEVGLQNQCNSLTHLEWAKDKGAQIFLYEDFVELGLKDSLEPLVGPMKGRPCLLSIDIDAFSSSEAPGCSQSWTTGLDIKSFLPALRMLQSTLDVRSLAIYEVSPPLDQDHRTSKLAALILHHALFNT